MSLILPLLFSYSAGLTWLCLDYFSRRKKRREALKPFPLIDERSRYHTVYVPLGAFGVNPKGWHCIATSTMASSVQKGVYQVPVSVWMYSQVNMGDDTGIDWAARHLADDEWFPLQHTTRIST